MQLIEHPADLRPGDIMFGPIGGLVGVGVGLGHLMLGEVFRMGRRSVRHVGIVTEGTCSAGGDCLGPCDRPRLAQAMPSGAEEVDFEIGKHWTDRHMYVRLPEDYPGQGDDAASIARLMVAEGVRYSPLSYLTLAAWRWGLKAERLERWIDRRRPVPRAIPLNRNRLGDYTRIQLPVEAICSVLVDQAWSLAGKRVMEGVARQCVTPGAMAGQLMHRAEAIIALPREDHRLPARSWEV